MTKTTSEPEITPEMITSHHEGQIVEDEAHCGLRESAPGVLVTDLSSFSAFSVGRWRAQKVA